MLTNLEILNGTLSPDYDINNNYYSVILNEEDTELDIYYETLNDNIEVVINGNENIFDEEKIVTLTMNDGVDIKTIHLTVNKTLSSTTSGLNEYFQALEIKKQEEVPEYIAPLIGSMCFLIIVITFSIIFHKKKKLK